MPTYLYETLAAPGAVPERIEVKQSIADAPLSTHPVSGKPVRRVISGGLATLTSKSADAPEPRGGCGPENCGCGRYS